MMKNPRDEYLIALSFVGFIILGWLIGLATCPGGSPR